MTSQGSVIIMLAIALVMLNPVQGFFMGRKAGKPFTAQVSDFFRHNHMYIFSWALVYTFWFHPMATDPQLLTGFFFMFLLFSQMSLAYTRIHLDLRWIVTLESWVALHALFVAIYNTIYFNSPDMWPMFFSGFAFMFVFTYMYALNIKKHIMWLITILYLGICSFTVYSSSIWIWKRSIISPSLGIPVDTNSTLWFSCFICSSCVSVGKKEK